MRVLTVGRFVALAAVAAGGSAASGAVLQESFNYAGTTLDGQAGGTGWNAAWTTSPADTSASLVTGLTFGNLATSGKALTLNAAATANAFTSATRQVGFSRTDGRVYASYLFSRAGVPNNSDAGIDYDGSAANDLRLFGKVYGTNKGGFRYALTGDTPYGNDLASNTTYMLVFGLDIGPGTNTGNYWALSAADFAAAQADPAYSGTFTDALLNAHNSAIGSGTTASTYVLSVGDSLAFRLYSEGAVGSMTVDELRVGDSLNEVMPVPEPGTAGAAAVLVGGLLAGRRRRPA